MEKKYTALQLERENHAQQFVSYLKSQIDTEKYNKSAELEAAVDNFRKEIEVLKTVESSRPLTDEQENLFRQLVRHKEENSQSGLITAFNIRGRPKYPTTVRKAEVGSSKASDSTIRACSQKSETLQQFSTTIHASNDEVKLQIAPFMHVVKKMRLFSNFLLLFMHRMMK